MAQLGKTTRQVLGVVRRWVRPHFAGFLMFNQPRLWALAIGLGLAGGLLGIAFRLAIGLVQSLWLGSATETVVTALAAFPWWWPVVGPLGGGIVVGIVLYFWRPPGRSGGVADVIELRAREQENFSSKDAAIATAISAITLGSGGSAGREGPVVYAAAAVSRVFARAFNLSAAARRIVLACGVAAVISSSFNAPIAGVLFAHEVILGHFAMSAFVPLVIGAVVAAVISRAWFGEDPAFVISDYHITSYFEIPAFALLGITCAAVAILFQTALIGGDWLSKRTALPIWVRPMIGGLLVGMIALGFPHVLGVGYEATTIALAGSMELWLMIALIFAKTLATAITLSSRAGGGVVSPTLYLGAMTGGAFGIIATSVFPQYASSVGLYAVIGMGAVAAAVLGAPISTAVMIFELTGGFAFSLALLLAVAISTGLCQAVMGRSFFHWQLYTRGLILDEGPHKQSARFIRVRDFMIPPAEDEDGDFDTSGDAPWLRPGDTLEAALKAFDTTSQSRLPVVDGTSGKLVGHARHLDALARFNAVLVAHSREEHS
ncbi:chloride channel protein [Pelagibacterium xiamenense]|uniref:chloride channel protein n=1 Tax=Pelagibacterium xiamenense TaxID=2901140 RepID=UPI001E4015F5|nr:chloride channel protein [Pelagibacterium xiamenense]MCD7060102.1 chloride channel protein [Pelagibacterium xiamenense]